MAQLRCSAENSFIMEKNRLIVSGLLCGAVLFGVGVAFHYLIPLVAPAVVAEYQNEDLFRPWGGWTKYYMFAHPWLFGVLFAGVFLGARKILGHADFGGARDGLLYGLAVFVVGSLPVYALNFASFQISAGLAASWVIQSMFQYSLAGLVLGWLNQRADDRSP